MPRPRPPGPPPGYDHSHLRHAPTLPPPGARGQACSSSPDRAEPTGRP
ncbi:hypothetical protein MicB006_2488 [Micromonospora sp. B006]|nr:hypothetical protein MicB006_2488 [Micromonospora sp. B006]